MAISPEKGRDTLLRFGVIGLGRAATSMVPSLAAHPHVRITAAADLRSEALDHFAREFGAEAYASAEDLCRSPSVDAVYIATPHQCHAEHVVMAARYGKHIIVEKPMALELEDCDAMTRAVERAGVQLIVGHTHSFDPLVLKIREIVRSGELGRLGMINMWNFTDFLYRPRRPEELDTAQGGGVLFNQVPHQVDTIRLIGGGEVRRVRAMTGIWDRGRPTEGSCAAFLEFADGAVATLVYSGYDHFDSDELHFGLSESGQKRTEERYGRARKALKSARTPEEEAAKKAATGYGGTAQKRERSWSGEAYHPHFGILIASCEHGDLRPSPAGVLVYGDEGKREVHVPLGRAVPDKGRVVDELYDAVVRGRRPVHDGYWGKATLEVCLAILESGRTRQEISLKYQVPVGD